jgi:hypothetical protein
MRTVHGARQLWLYDAATLAPLRALLPPDDSRTQTGVTAVDPDGDDRVVFVRRLTIDVAATDGPAQPPLIAWRLDEFSLATHQSGVLSPPRLGPGPDHLFFSAQGHRLAVVTDVDVEVLDTFDDGVAPVTLAIPPRTTVLGFLAADGPLLMSRLDSSTRQTVVAVDTEQKAPDTVVYDSLVANCNPTQQLWVPPTGVLVLRTRCGNARTDPTSDEGLGFYVVDATGPRRIAASTSPLNYSSSVSWDSTGAALIEEFTPICDGQPVFDRVTMSGIRSRIAGAFVAQTCF